MAKYFAQNITEHAQKKFVFSRKIFLFASEKKKVYPPSEIEKANQPKKSVELSF